MHLSNAITVEETAWERGDVAPLEIRTENPLACVDWNARTSGQPGFGFFHTAEWAGAIAGTYGYRPLYLTARRTNRLVSVLPLMEVDSWFTGRRGIALPWTDECGPTGGDSASSQRLLQEAIAIGRNRGWKYVELRGGKSLLPRAPASDSFYGHQLKLAGDEQYHFARLESAVRRAIRKAEKARLRVEIRRDAEAMGIFYSLHCRTRRKHGVPPQPYRFFQNISERVLLRDKGIIVMATHDGRPVTANLYFHSGTDAIYKYGASADAFQDLRGNNLVMWEAIKWYLHNGFKTLDFGRTSVQNEGLRRFKLGWGVHEYQIDYVRYDLRKQVFAVGRDEAFGWYNRVFRALPITLSRLAGKVLYRHMA